MHADGSDGDRSALVATISAGVAGLGPDGQSIYVSRFLEPEWLRAVALRTDGTESLVVPIKQADQPRESGQSSLGAVVSQTAGSFTLRGARLR